MKQPPQICGLPVQPSIRPCMIPKGHDGACANWDCGAPPMTDAEFLAHIVRDYRKRTSAYWSAEPSERHEHLDEMFRAMDDLFAMVSVIGKRAATGERP